MPNLLRLHTNPRRLSPQIVRPVWHWPLLPLRRTERLFREGAPLTCRFRVPGALDQRSS
jgi:hypothetical protein